MDILTHSFQIDFSTKDDFNIKKINTSSGSHLKDYFFSLFLILLFL